VPAVLGAGEHAAQEEQAAGRSSGLPLLDEMVRVAVQEQPPAVLLPEDHRHPEVDSERGFAPVEARLAALELHHVADLVACVGCDLLVLAVSAGERLRDPLEARADRLPSDPRPCPRETLALTGCCARPTTLSAAVRRSKAPRRSIEVIP
jgi:hypothetical protein